LHGHAHPPSPRSCRTRTSVVWGASGHGTVRAGNTTGAASSSIPSAAPSRRSRGSGGCPGGTVRSHLWRAREQVRKAAGGCEGGSPSGRRSDGSRGESRPAPSAACAEGGLMGSGSLRLAQRRESRRQHQEGGPDARPGGRLDGARAGVPRIVCRLRHRVRRGSRATAGNVPATY